MGLTESFPVLNDAYSCGGNRIIISLVWDGGLQ